MMANRYSRTGFTARQVKTLKSCREDLRRILVDRSSKQDSTKSLVYLQRAADVITFALEEAEAWKRS